MNQPKPLVSLIILSWGRKNEILETLGELQRQIYKDFEIVVIDQGSADKLPEEIVRKYPEIKLIRLAENIGVPAGRNLGVLNSGGQFLFFLDNDAVLGHSSLQKIVDKFKECPEVGIIGCAMLNYVTKELDKDLWGYPGDWLKYAKSEFESYTYCGGGCAIKREVFERVGLFWEDLFFGCEEIDYGIRTLDKGYKIIYFPEAKVFHRVSKEKKTSLRKLDCYVLRNSLWVSWRLLPASRSIPATLTKVLTYLIKSVKHKYLGLMIKTTVKAFKKAGFIWEKDYKVRYSTYKEYMHLRGQSTFLSKIRRVFQGQA